jgi:hypothetical protein
MKIITSKQTDEIVKGSLIGLAIASSMVIAVIVIAAGWFVYMDLTR